MDGGQVFGITCGYARFIQDAEILMKSGYLHDFFLSDSTKSVNFMEFHSTKFVKKR